MSLFERLRCLKLRDKSFFLFVLMKKAKETLACEIKLTRLREATAMFYGPLGWEKQTLIIC